MFSEGHNNGIVKGIPIDRPRRENVDFLPYNFLPKIKLRPLAIARTSLIYAFLYIIENKAK